MTRRYVTADVFTTTPFHGNPIPVVLDAAGLSDAQMAAIAREFNTIETTFVLPPADPAHTAHVRIFTPAREIPFAGHPNIGTAFVLAREHLAQGRHTERMVFEEAAGLVELEIFWEAGHPIGAELVCPEPYSRRGSPTAADAAACLRLNPADIRIDRHGPVVVSVGLPFLAVELTSRDALRRAQPDREAYGRVLPLDGAHSIYLYTQDADQPDCHLMSRMFTGYMAEDPATGSATAAVSALQAELWDSPDLSLRIRQGVDMGRPSTLLTRVIRTPGADPVVKLAGQCVAVMEGTLHAV